MLDPIRAAIQRTAQPQQNDAAIQPQQTVSVNMEAARNLFKTLTASKNPQALITQLAQNNPQIGTLLSALNGTNKQVNMKVVYETLAKQCGVDPTQFLKDLQS